MRLSMIPLAIALACAAAAPASRPARVDHTDELSFELTAVPPPVPALRYRLAVDAAERHAGNAAVAYLQAGLYVSADEVAILDRADEAEDAGDRARFAAVAGPLFATRAGAVDVLDDASRCQQCDWGFSAARLQGGTWMPQLNTMRTLSDLLLDRARFEMRAGRTDEALASIRWGLELGRRVGEGETLISGSVGIGVAARVASALPELMSRPDAPNLYWALTGVRRPLVSFAGAVGGERRFQLQLLPVLAKGRAGGITADDWRSYLDQMDAFAAAARYVVFKAGDPPPPPAPPPTSALATSVAAVAVMPQSSAHWARTRHVTPAEAAKVDPQLLAATWLIESYQATSDEQDKLLGLPYPQLLPRWRAVPQRLAALGMLENNLFAIAVPSMGRAAETFARVDRTMAALTAVEAVRSYAADHGGRLPASLADVTDTPPPDNPVTGRPFEWHVTADNVGALGDHDPLLDGRPLSYAVRVSRP